MDIAKGKTTVAEVARLQDLTVYEIEGWIDEARAAWQTSSGLARRTSASSTDLNCGRPSRRWARPTCRFIR
ncbi:hypothetical protein [Halomonas sp.]|uniref:hypothetical protein n=1 Tax=Halomonas sp. TaxID=1486246 RepID=UPI00338E5926